MSELLLLHNWFNSNRKCPDNTKAKFCNIKPWLNCNKVQLKTRTRLLLTTSNSPILSGQINYIYFLSPSKASTILFKACSLGDSSTPSTNQEREYLGYFNAKDWITECGTADRLLSVVASELEPTPNSRSSLEIEIPSCLARSLIRSCINVYNLSKTKKKLIFWE